MGQRVHLSMSREKVLAAISVLLIAGGISLLVRNICCLSNLVRSPALESCLLRFSAGSATAR